jgi:tight adherence protein C
VAAPLLYVGAVAIVAACALLLWAALGFRDDTRSLVASNLQRGDLSDLREIRLARPTSERALEPLIGRLATLVRRFTPMGSLGNLERKLVLAGRPPAWPIERVLAAKVVLGLTGLFLTIAQLAIGSSAGIVAIMVGLTVLLFITPDVMLTARASERQREILLALPDTLDQMTICVEAGLGFEAAMARAGQTNTGPLAQEIVRTLQEIQVGVGRRRARTALTDRTQVPDLRHFVTAILQAERYGVPIARVLDDQARELRLKRRQRAEETARKLPLKLLLPLIAFVLPPMFVIVIGPAILQLTDSFSGLSF